MAKALNFSGKVLLLVVLVLSVGVQPLQAMRLSDTYSTNQYTHVDTLRTDWEIRQDIPKSYRLVAENETYRLFVDFERLAFKVVDRRSGYVWHSNLDEVTREDRLNKTWTAFAQSGISIDYLDQKATPKRASITNAKHTIEVTPVEQGIEAQVTFTEPAITIGVNLILEKDGVRVEVPFERIRQENEKFKLGVLYVYPFFAATRGDEVPGYMFLPDGSGALIRFSEQTKAKNMFYGRVYGADLGMTTSMPFDPDLRRPFRVSVPVIGMVHGYHQNAYLAVLERGAGYAEIQAHPAGIITQFNFLHYAFIYNESYFQPTNRAGTGVTVLQPQTNAFDVILHYRFLTGGESDYVGMARSYRQYLIDQGALKSIPVPDENIGIRLEFLNAERKKVLLWNEAIPMTTFEQMRQILQSLQVNHPEVILYGWQTLGASSMFPRTLRLESALGSKADLRALVEQVIEQGGRLSLYLDPQAAVWDEPGYSPRFDLARSIANLNLTGYNRYKAQYFLNLEALSDRLKSLSADLSRDFPSAGLALDGIGGMLYSDYRTRPPLNREQTILAYQDFLRGLPVSTGLYAPNDYLWGIASAVYDLPISSSGYLYTTDTVPFLQIVLSGSVPYYGQALNFSPDLQEDLLRHADFGAYPSFFVTQEETAKILETRSRWIYTSSIEQWRGEIERVYAWLNARLGAVRGASMVARTVVQEGVVLVTYSNGKQIAVNYTAQPVQVGGVTIPARDALLLEGEITGGAP
ncbi:DUF5696 domain-containing protein [Anaerolinea thermophila]|uniref:Uncharacterized protein n=1 Tax=Anaerolinea thermophila (strain DSM 14523 / JCM 11388 / NBRC 100420 / UNI-1) TaxID=926569 RepID=E8N0B2_ANATU|nr:DUF5696 domain-containing protein [Anaerolinea thermophila]BAJ64661.1 hypothetical protein ANT_26350 [Anaerolinea thermophila UNI-1]